MSYETGTATSYTDLLDKLNTFLTKGHSLTPAYTGTGNGTISGVIGTSSSSQETITVTLTSATAFSVSGSVTGSMGTGTVGTLFTHAKVSFTVNAGGTAWVNGDTIVFVMTPAWVQQRGVSGSEYIWKAPGNANADSIYVGAIAYTDAVGYYNWRLGGFTGYASGSVFTAQPGYVGIPGPHLPLWNSSIPYWFVASGRRVIVIAKVSTQYEPAYLGFAQQYPSPGAWPYPLVVGGAMAFNSEPATGSTSWLYSNATTQHRAFPISFGETSNDVSQQLRVRRPDGLWRGCSSNTTYSTAYGSIWPYAGTMNDLRPNLDGSYPLLPIVLSEDQGTNVYNIFGELEGIMATTGHAQAAENTITVGRDTWLVVQNIARTGKADYYAVRLD